MPILLSHELHYQSSSYKCKTHDHYYLSQCFIWTQGDVLVPTQTHFVLLLRYRITFGNYLIVLNNFKSKMQDWSLR